MDSLPVNYSNNDLWEYNQQTNTWTAKTDCPVYRQHPGYFSIGTYGYVSGGYSRNGVYKDTYRYAAITDTWSTNATYPGEARYAPVTFATASYGYVGFGHNAAGSHLNDLWKFEPVYSGNGGTWRVVGSYPLRGHFTGIQANPTTGYIIGVNCDNDNYLYTNSLNYYTFNQINGSITNLNVNSTNSYANTSKDYIKTGEYIFNLNNNITVGGGLSKTSEVSIKPNPPLAYSQLEYDISYIIPIVYESPKSSTGSYVCKICNQLINDSLHIKSYKGISTHTIIQCETCKTAYSAWYDTTLLATYWVGGFTNNIKTAYACDGVDYAPLYPDIAKGNRTIQDKYIVTYRTDLKVIH